MENYDLHIETCQTFGKVILVLKWKRRFEWKSSRNSRDLVLTTWTSTLLSKHRHYLATGCSLKCDTIKIKLQFSQVHRLPPLPPPLTHRPGNLLHPSVHVRRGDRCVCVMSSVTGRSNTPDLDSHTPLPALTHYHTADGCDIVKLCHRVKKDMGYEERIDR